MKRAGIWTASGGSLLLIVLQAGGWVTPVGFTLAVVALLFVGLLSEATAPELLVLAALGLLLVGDRIGGGILRFEQAFQGFSNSAVITVGALFVVAAAVRNTGVFDRLASLVLGPTGTARTAIARMALPLAGMSAFFNNTPIVSIFMPNLREWALRQRIAPSKLLIPLSYLTIFGGMCTLIGTSTNLVIDGLAQREYGWGLSFFAIAWVGIPCSLVASVYLATIGVGLLPDREDALSQLNQSMRQYLVEMKVVPGSPLDGTSISDAGFRHIVGLFLFEVKRGGRIFAPVKGEFVLQGGDTLVFSGEVGQVIELQKIQGLSAPMSPERLEIGDKAQLVEVVVSPSSPLVGKSIEDVWFNRRYDATVLALHRNGQDVVSNMSLTPLRPGDTLLMVAGIGFRRMWQNSSDFYLVSPLRHDIYLPKHAPVALAVVILMVLLTGLGVVPIKICALIAALVLVFSGCVPEKSALQTVDWGVLVVIGGAFGIAQALSASGASAWIAEGIGHVAAGRSPLVAMLILYLGTSLMTELITNNAAAALAFPIAANLASKLGVEPMPLVMTVAVAAAASFATPIGYQTNMLVYGPGGYRFSDYLKVGLPVSAIFCVGTLLVVPRIWSL